MRGALARLGAAAAIGVETGQMMTMDDLDHEAYRAAMATRDDRHWVYHRAGLPCRVCGTHDRDGRAGRPQALLVPVLPGVTTEIVG